MTNYYVDLDGGSDATGDGTNPATPYKTISAATGAIGNGNHECRVAKTPDSQTLTPTGTWTKASDTITLSAAQNASLYLEGAWTDGAGGNVTCATDASEMEGANCASMVIGGGFGGSALAAYFPLAGGATDLSGYEQISLWLRASTTIADGKWTLKLCSDAAGATPVDSIALKFCNTANDWIACVGDTAGALGASIQSVALYSEDGTPGTPTIYIDNVITAKAAGNADEITHLTVLSPGANGAGYGWYQPKGIDGTSISILSGMNTSGYSSEFSFTTVTTGTLYGRQCFHHEDVGTNNDLEYINASGTSAALPHLVSGGWDLSGPTQDGETFYTAGCGNGYGFRFSGEDYIEVEKLSVFNCLVGYYSQNSVYSKITDCDFGAALNYCSEYSGGLHIMDTVRCSSNYYESMYAIGSDEVYMNDCIFSGSGFGYANFKASKSGYVFGRNIVMGWPGASNGAIVSGAAGSPSGVMEFVNLTVLNDSRSGPVLYNVTGGGYAKVRSLTTDCTSFYEFHADSESKRFSLDIEILNGDTDDHRKYFAWGNVVTDNSVRHTASGLSWKMSPTSANCDEEHTPVKMMVAKLACKASVAVTATCWFRRTHGTNVDGKLIVKGGQLTGVANDVEDPMTAAADTWEQLTVQFTPTQQGVIEIEAHAWGGTTDSVYVDDFEAV